MCIKLIIILVNISLCVAYSTHNTTILGVRYFPKDFIFGVSTSAYQIEGAWNEDGKSESIWDHLVHTNPETIKDRSTGDDANKSYRLYKRDVEMIRELGVDFYRFSLSWTRILPTSFPNKINQLGVDYYNNLINELLKYNIQPIVTLYHWDLPHVLQEMGGWTNPAAIDWFSDYARVAFKLFGDRVKYWITINEPELICHFSYSMKYLAPRIELPGIAEYMCSKNILLAHAKVYHIYDKEFRESQRGNIFISISAFWYEPVSIQDAEAAENHFQFEVGHYAHPIFTKSGDWPPVMKEKIAAKSAEQGFYRSRLPSFTPEEVEFIRGSSDFYGLNHYSTFMVNTKLISNDYPSPSRDEDLAFCAYKGEEWKDEYTATIPWGFYKTLMKIKEDYGNPPVIVTENGYASSEGLIDDKRINFHRLYLDALLNAIDAGANVKGYSAWSLMDNFEWVQGFTEKFGLYQVDNESMERTRTPRKSAFIYKQIVKTRALDPNYEPNSTVMTIDEENWIMMNMLKKISQTIT